MKQLLLAAALLLSACATHSPDQTEQIKADIKPYLAAGEAELAGEPDDLISELYRAWLGAELKLCTIRVYFEMQENCGN